MKSRSSRRRRGRGATRQFDRAHPDRGEPVVQPLYGNGGKERTHQPAPAIGAVGWIGGRAGIERQVGPIDQFGTDLQVGPASVAVGELGRRRPHEGGGERPDVVDPCGLVVVEEVVAVGFDARPVLGQHGEQQPPPVGEVVLECGRVALPRSGVDLTERHRLDAPPGEELLGRLDQSATGQLRVRRHGGAHDRPFDALA